MEVEATSGVHSGEVTSPVRRVLLVSAGASHSVALLCKLRRLFVLKFTVRTMRDGLGIETVKEWLRELDNLEKWIKEINETSINITFCALRSILVTLSGLRLRLGIVRIQALCRVLPFQMFFLIFFVCKHYSSESIIGVLHFLNL